LIARSSSGQTPSSSMAPYGKQALLDILCPQVACHLELSRRSPSALLLTTSVSPFFSLCPAPTVVGGCNSGEGRECTVWRHE
jgi:hypothetical protein